MLATDSINPLVKLFSFLTDSIDQRPLKNFVLIESDHRLDFFLVKSIDLINVFLQLIDYQCSVSRWRPHKVDKRMVLEYTHGLFIT
jgi:hypothetical protein